ncbi:MAG: ATP-binding protein [Planctomycetes bacterium]|nr:ATP-binding protein [Planctomycetota bacterium]
MTDSNGKSRVRKFSPLKLSQAQQTAYDELKILAGKGQVSGLVCRPGRGRTTILRNLSAELGAPLVTMADVGTESERLHPYQLEEGFLHAILAQFEHSNTVIVDDVHVFMALWDTRVTARPKILSIVLDTLLAHLSSDPKLRIVIGIKDEAPPPLAERCLLAKIERFTPEDYGFLFASIAGEALDKIDWNRVHRFAPKLSAHQIAKASVYLKSPAETTTDAMLELLETLALASNVDTGKVEEVSLDSLFGVDDVVRSLEADVVVPLERPDLADSLGLTAKRGVLLYGPPGTGKTTVGRALAHRLGSKFFLIDGTVISGTTTFYETIYRIFSSAQENSPSIVFIDDSDVIFENSGETGLYRYLLTMLDGLESKESSTVCVIITAMNIGSLPPALIRSGRIELWLEMQLPGAMARTKILASRLREKPEIFRKLDPHLIASKTDGLTGADLKRLTGDSVNLYGYDVAFGNPLKSAEEYFDEALEKLRANRERLDNAPQFTAPHHGRASRAGMVKAKAMLKKLESEE